MNCNTANKSVKDILFKKDYRCPELAIYGNISEVTRMVNPTGDKNDSGIPMTGSDKT
jgi:hypothetical protein